MNTSSRTNDQSLKRIEWLAWLMDDSITVPGTNIKIGWDGIVNFIPGLGSFAGTIVSVLILIEAMALKLPFSIYLRFALNIFIDAIGGALPVVGWIFDFGFKANRRNLKIVQDYLALPNRTLVETNEILVSVVLVVLTLIILTVSMVIWMFVLLAKGIGVLLAL